MSRPAEEIEEPRRLSQLGADPSAQMLRAVKRVGASSSAQTRLYRRAAWLTVVSLASSYTAAAAAAVGGAKAITVVATLGVAAGVGAYTLSHVEPEVLAPAPQVRQPAPEARDVTPGPAPVQQPPVAEQEDPEPGADVALPPAPKAERKPGTQPLSHEIKLIDEARNAVRSGQGARALKKLADYRKRFPQARFALEASALEIEALAVSGQTARAKQLAQRFIEQHPKSLLATRLRRYAD